MFFRTGNHLVQQNELSQSNTRLSNYKPSMALAKVIASMEPAIRLCALDRKHNWKNQPGYKSVLLICIQRHNVWITLNSLIENPRNTPNFYASPGRVFSSPNCNEVTRHTTGGWWSKQWADLIRTQQRRPLEPQRWRGALGWRVCLAPGLIMCVESTSFSPVR